MSYAIGKPVVSANIVIDEEVTELKIGDSVSGMVVVGNGSSYEVSGTVVGISLGRVERNSHLGPIFDGVPTFKFESDDMANIHNAADYFEVDFLMVEVEGEDEGAKPTYVKVPVRKIKAMSGGVDEGTKTDPPGDNNNNNGEPGIDPEKPGEPPEEKGDKDGE